MLAVTTGSILTIGLLHVNDFDAALSLAIANTVAADDDDNNDAVVCGDDVVDDDGGDDEHAYYYPYHCHSGMANTIDIYGPEIHKHQ